MSHLAVIGAGGIECLPRVRRWQSLSLAEQCGNVGSEISRAIRWSTKNPATAQAALYRGLELFDLMLDDPRHRASVARLREIARAKSS